MATSTLYVMLIWSVVLPHRGGPAVVQGFTTLEKCEYNRPFVEVGYKSIGVESVKTICTALINN